jgi:hypothetical protein
MDIGSGSITNIVSAMSLIISIGVAVIYYTGNKHKVYTIESEYINGLIRWHSEVVTVLILLKLTVRNVDIVSRQDNLARLSALIECGRFYFPNIYRDKPYGKYKPPAYQGYRSLVLDFLVASYNLFSKDEIRSKDLEQARFFQMNFTSIVFDIVVPTERLEKLKALTGKYFVQEKIFEDFKDTGDASLLEHIWNKPRL